MADPDGVVESWTLAHLDDLRDLRGRRLIALAIDNFSELYPGGLVGEAVALILATLYEHDALPPAAASEYVMHAWSHSQYPQTVLTNDQWRTLFRVAGFVRGYGPAERPTSPLVLYRGATLSHRAGWSWTGDRARAVEYAQGKYQRHVGRVWTAQVSPERLLGQFDDRGESEYVVDTDGLIITQHHESG